MQQWFAYSDPAMEEALHNIPLRRAFAGRDATVEAIPRREVLYRLLVFFAGVVCYKTGYVLTHGQVLFKYLILLI